jgi:Tfp pilus assembly protein PilF
MEDLFMKRRHSRHLGTLQITKNTVSPLKVLLHLPIWRYAIIVALGVTFTCEFTPVSRARSLGGNSEGLNAQRGTVLLFGDVSVPDSQAPGEKPGVIELILVTKLTNQETGRERVSGNGRYSFPNVPRGGDYWIVIENDGKEIARDSVFIASGSMANEVRHDITLARATPKGGGVISAADAYNRSDANKALYQKAKHELDGKNYPQAIAMFREIVAADPKDFPAWSELGTLYFVQKDFEAAEKSYVGATAAQPDYFPALLSLGRVRMARKDYEHAIESLEAAVKADPTSASANYFLGEAYLQVKKGSKAVVCLNEALKLDPQGMADAHLRLATLYNSAGMKDRAAAEYEQFLKKKPDYPEKKVLEDYITANKKP